MGTAASLGMWKPVESTLADRFDLVSFDYRGLGDSERADGTISVATLAEFLAWTAPLTHTTPEQIQTVAEQWEADINFDSLDRVAAIAAPALALTGEQDIITPPRHGRAVAERIPGATFELMTGTGAGHGLMFERAADSLRTVLRFLEQHPLAG
jgi:pimeloyl-ACP methyl ester carboxylesterase